MEKGEPLNPKTPTDTGDSNKEETKLAETEKEEKRSNGGHTPV